jgi:hypothetical protein
MFQMPHRVPTLKLVKKSPQQQEKASKAPKHRKPGKEELQAAREMWHLLDSYAPPPSSTVILGRVSIESIQWVFYSPAPATVAMAHGGAWWRRHASGQSESDVQV